MSKLLTVLPLCAALALMAPVASFAQTASDETTEQAEEEAPQAGSSGTTATIEDQLSLGEDADSDPKLGQPYTLEEVGAWEIRCINTKEETDPCQMYQLLEDDQGSPVAEVSLFRLAEGGKAEAGATIIVPLETSLLQQLTVSVDGGKARRYPFALCDPVGCYVRLGLTSADVTAYKRGNEAVITIVPALAPDQKVELKLSLEGFTAGYEKASVIKQ